VSVLLGASWILARSAWEATSRTDPRKALAIDVWTDLHTSLLWPARNGSQPQPKRGWLPRMFHREGELATGGGGRTEEADANRR
jgi:hypothetical protein